MSIQSNIAVMEYDEQGDLVIRIPRHLAKQYDADRIAFAIEGVLHQPVAQRAEHGWDNDPLLDLIGRFEADVSDGSQHHDKYLYLDRMP